MSVRAWPAWVMVLVLSGCEAGSTPGAGCARSSECPSDLVCSRGRCRNGCARSDDCPALARCLVDPTTSVGTCSLDVDSCHTHACPLGFVCRDDECLNACGAIVQCPDRVCSDGACVPMRGVDAGPSDDAGLAPTSALAIGAGEFHFCAATAARQLWCWGYSSEMQLGDGLVVHGDCADCSAVPVLARRGAVPLENVRGVTGGGSYTCAVIGDGVSCFGGAPLAGGSVTPDALAVTRLVGGVRTALAHVQQVEGGLLHACAIVDEGTPRVWCWGVGDDGQLANGDSVSSIDAVLATELPDAPSALTLSYHHTMALGSDGAIVGVGANPTRGLGVDALGDATAAVRASLVPAARRLTTGAADTCAILVDGRLACWGLSSKLETDTDPSTLTMGPRGLCSSTPTFFTLPTTEPIAGIAVVASQPSTAACVWTESSGEVYCVGDPPYATSSVEPTRVDGLTDVTDVVASDSALCALTRGGEVYCWGDDAHGQLGRGTHDDGTSATPTRVTLGP